MALKQREKILMGASLIALAATWILTAPSSTPPSSSTATEANDSATTVIASAEKMAVTLNTLNKKPTLAKTDPFKPVSAVPTAPSTSQTQAPSSNFLLQGIFTDSKGRAAVLNGEIIYEGSEIVPGVRLKEVHSTDVIISRLGEESTVRLEP